MFTHIRTIPTRLLTVNPSHLQHPTIFCVVLTNLKHLDTKAKTVYTSWGYKCSDYRFISLVPGHHLKTERIDTKPDGLYKLLKPKGLYNDTYDNLTYKVLLAFEDVYNTYSDFDCYLKADDDTFIFYDNLRDFVATKKPSDPVTFGFEFKEYGGYLSGGAGYLLSREALRRLMLNWKGVEWQIDAKTEDVEEATIKHESAFIVFVLRSITKGMMCQVGSMRSPKTQSDM